MIEDVIKILLAAVICLTLAHCDIGKGSSSVESSSTIEENTENSADINLEPTDDRNLEPADVPVPVTGMPLTMQCTPLKADQNTGTYQIGCDIYDENQKTKVNPSVVLSQFQWTYSGFAGTDIAIKEGAPDQGYTATFDIGQTSYVAISELKDLQIEFLYEDPGTKTQAKLTRRLDQFFLRV